MAENRFGNVVADSRSDEDLIEASNGGNGAAFEVLYLRHRDWVVRVAERMTGDGRAAVGVVRGVFLRFLGEFPGVGQFVSVRSHLYRMARGMAVDVIRGKKRESPEEGERLQGMMARVEFARETVGEAEAAGLAALAAWVNRLAVGQREILLMRMVDGMSVVEIADALEIPEGTVESRLERGMAALRGDGRSREYFEG